MIELSEKLRKYLKTIPLSIISELWEIGQEHDYASIRRAREWNIEDEFWRQISYAHREGNNPDDYKVKKVKEEGTQRADRKGGNGVNEL